MKMKIVVEKSNQVKEEIGKYENNYLLFLMKYCQYLLESGEDVYRYEGDLIVCLICKYQLFMLKYLFCLYIFCESCIGDYFQKFKGKFNFF